MIKSTEIELLGDNYTIKSETSQERVKELANYLDTKMKEIRAVAPNATLLKVAILAAFYITEELFENRIQLKETLNIMEEKAYNILKMLEDSSISVPVSDSIRDNFSIT